MKKLLSGLCVLLLVVLVPIGFVSVNAETTKEEDYDRVFRQAFEEIASAENISADVVTVKREAIFDLTLKQLGFIYLMQYSGKEGYAIVVNTEGMFNVTEFYMDACNPYQAYTGQKVYANILMYLVYIDGRYVETETGAVLNDADIDKLQQKAFCSTLADFETGNETIFYVNKSVNKYALAKQHPAYYPRENIVNACTPAAGANIIGYWTRYCPDLMPGFIPGSIKLGHYFYKEKAEEAYALVENLYYVMGTNTVNPGTTIAGFKEGMNSFVAEKGRQIEYIDCKTDNRFDYSFAKQQLEAGKPLVLFIDGFRIDTFNDGSNQMLLNYTIGNTAHTITGFGYNETTYTLTDGTQRTDCYIQAATGLIKKPKGYYNINYGTTIDACYAISIY